MIKMINDIIKQLNINSYIETLIIFAPGIISWIIIIIILLLIYVIGNKIIRKIFEFEHNQISSSALRIWKLFLLFVTLLILILLFSGNLAAAGISIGLLSAALGWALQKPITGIAAWIMITLKKPFDISDRIIIDDIKGDVKEISMFYILLDECGGTTLGDELSGRTILIPTSQLFEKPIINYTKTNKYVRDETIVSFTYESDLKNAEKIVLEAAKKFIPKTEYMEKRQPITRIEFKSSSVEVRAKYFTFAKELLKTKTNIVREIHSKIMKTKGVEFAYPHTQLVFGDKNPFKKKKNKKY